MPLCLLLLVELDTLGACLLLGVVYQRLGIIRILVNVAFCAAFFVSVVLLSYALYPQAIMSFSMDAAKPSILQIVVSTSKPSLSKKLTTHLVAERA
jgi:hypothetical protein